MKQANNIVLKDVVVFKKIFLAAVMVIASPSFVTAQDIFFSFDSQSVVTTLEDYDSSQTSGSVYIFSDGLFGFDALDLEFSTSGSGVIEFTGGETFNPEFNVVGGFKFDVSDLSFSAAGDMGRLFSVSITENGVNPSLGPLFDPGFDAGVGGNGAVLLARVDFDIVDRSDVTLEFNLGLQGAFQLPNNDLNPSFGSAELRLFILNACYNGLPGEEPPMIPGDFNWNCTVDFDDVAPFVSVLVSRRYDFYADMDQNGVVDFLDIGLFVSYLNN